MQLVGRVGFRSDQRGFLVSKVQPMEQFDQTLVVIVNAKVDADPLTIGTSAEIKVLS